MNFIAWSNFLGQCLLAYLLVEGAKDVIFGLRTPRRSFWRVGLNLLAGALAGWFIVPGSGLFPQTRSWFVVSISPLRLWAGNDATDVSGKSTGRFTEPPVLDILSAEFSV